MMGSTLVVNTPGLNPDEGVWGHLNRVELRNVVSADLAQLRRAVRTAVERLLGKPNVPRSCVRGRAMFTDSFTSL